MKNLTKSMLFSLLVAAPLLFGAQVSHAQGDHPNYLRALSDLRLMHGYLAGFTLPPGIEGERIHSLQEIEEAIREVKDAAIEDGKDLRYNPPIDAHITSADRFRKAREAGNAAWADIDREEDNGFAQDLKHRALKHIEEANHTIDRIEKQLRDM